MKNVFKFLGIIAIIAVIGFSMTACGEGDPTNNEGEPTPQTLTYSGVADGITFTIVITEDTARYTAQVGDIYELTVSGEERKSTGKVTATGSTLTLMPSKVGASTFTVAVNGENISSISGEIAFDTGEPMTAPIVQFTSGPPRDLNGTWVSSRMKIVLNNGNFTLVEVCKGTYYIIEGDMTVVYIQHLGSVIAGDMGVENLGLIADQWYTLQQCREAIINYMVENGKDKDEAESDVDSLAAQRNDLFGTYPATYTLSGNTLTLYVVINGDNEGEPETLTRQ